MVNIEKFTHPKSQRSFKDAINSSVIIEVNRNGFIYTSSAIIIADKFLLTAAHCVDKIDSGKVIFDEIYNYNTKNFIHFEKVIIHPGYNKENSNYKNDLALVRLKELSPFKFANIDYNLQDNKYLRLGFGDRQENRKTIVLPRNFNLKEENYFNLTDYNSVIGDSGGPIFSIGHEINLIGIHSTLEGTNLTYSSFVPFYKDWINEQIKNYKLSSIH